MKNRAPFQLSGSQTQTADHTHRVTLGPLCMVSTRSRALFPSPATAIPCSAALKHTSDGITPEAVCMFCDQLKNSNDKRDRPSDARNIIIVNNDDHNHAGDR